MKKKTSKKEDLIVVSLGGSVVYPYKESNATGLDVSFLSDFRAFILFSVL